MCMLAKTVKTELGRVLAEWVAERRTFDTLAVRDELRRCCPKEDVRYGDVFPEIWHAFRKGELAGYIVRTKQVATPTGIGTTVEYVSAEVAVLAKVRQAWEAANEAAAARRAA